MIGFIGLGQIGRPMARRLVDGDSTLWVADVDETATQELAAAGAKVAGTPAELAAHARVISIMVRDDAQVRDVLCHPSSGILAAAAPGTVVAVHSTINPDTARELAAAGAEHGVDVLDAPVSGGAPGAVQGRLAILVGGSQQGYQAALPVLQRMGDLVCHLGPVGAGTAAKLARNLLHFVAFAAAGESLALAEAAGIDLRTLGEVVRHTDAITGGPGAIMWRDTAAPPAPEDPWVAILNHVWQLGHKDLTLATELADRLNVDTPLADLALRRLALGLGVEPEQRNE